MADDILHALQHLRGLSPEIHWFCPRAGLDDDSYWYDEDLAVSGHVTTPVDETRRQEKLQEVAERKKLVLEAIKILAFDGPDAAPFKEWIVDHLQTLMRTCDVCVRIYHRFRTELKVKLEAEHDADDVRSFLADFDAMNRARITEGLETAMLELSALPPERRMIQVLQPAGLYAMFESLSCMPVLLDEPYLAEKFDPPFAMVQKRKPLKLNNLVPAAFHFLFSSNQERYAWAYYTVSRHKSPISQSEFEWNIKDALLAAMGRVQLYNLDRAFLPKFWDAAKVIVSKLDKDLITHSLKALDFDLCRLVLEHMAIDTPGLQDLLTTFQTLLERSPNSVWDSMEAVGAISPVTVLDQVFNNRAFERAFAFRDTVDEGNAEMSWLSDITGWISPFMASIKPINRVPACRTLANQLLGRFQCPERFPPRSAQFAFSCGIDVMFETLVKLLEGNTPETFAGPAPVAEILEIVRSHVGLISSKVRGAKLGDDSQTTEVLKCLNIVKDAVRLDCLWLAIESRQIRLGRAPTTPRGNDTPFWEALISNIQRGDQALAIHALAGTQELISLEDLIIDSKSDARERAVREAYNASLAQTLTSVRQLVDQISEFSQLDLTGIFTSLSDAQTVLLALFYPRFETRIAAVEVVKGFSGQTGRREAFQHLVQLDLRTTLGALTGSVRLVTAGGAYAPSNALLKVCTDVLDALCDSQDGVLQSRSVSPSEGLAAERFWMAMWHLMSHIFTTTESWNDIGHDKGSLVDFCRDTMQFADRLFDDYSVLHTVVPQSDRDSNLASDATVKSEDHGVSKRLLRAPNTTMAAMAKWLRLRDEYLSIKIVSLVSKLLRRLHDENVSPSDSTVGYIQDVIEGKVKTKLTFQQLAELRRALEDTGYVLDYEEKKDKEQPKGKDKVQEKAKLKKQTSLGGWFTPTNGSPKFGSEPDSISKVVSDASSAAARFKEMMCKREAEKTIGRLPPGVFKPPDVDTDTAAEFRRKRAADLEAKKARDRAAAAKARGGNALRATDHLANAGTGIRGLGVLGKEHGRGEGMMVSSDDSDSSGDDSDDLDRELFGLTAQATRPKVIAPAKAPVVRGPVRKERRIRSQRDMRARLTPDLSSLHKTILSWDIFFKSEYPPGCRSDLYQSVPSVFTNPDDYQRVFKSLLLLEAWQGLVKIREEQGTVKPFEIRIAGRTSVDLFIEMGTSMENADHMDAGVFEGDLVLLSLNESQVEDMTAPHCLARVGRVIRKRDHVEVTYRVIGGGNPMGPSLAPNNSVFGIKLQSLTPLEREYGALVALQYYDLCDEIIRATPAPMLEYTEKELTSLAQTYKLNTAQARAVKSAIDNDSFTLIQGPPGSGKTKTITAIVGAILSTAYATKTSYLNETIIQRPGGAGRTVELAAKKMLVCAPSNAAVDELVLRLKQGVTSMSGTHRPISVVRIGRSDAINAGVMDVTLDELVTRALAEAAATGKDDQDKKNGEGKNEDNSIHGLMKQHQATSAELAKVRNELETAKPEQLPQLRSDFSALKQRQQQLSAQIDQARDKQKSESRQSEMTRRRTQQTILSNADIICATLSGSGHEVFQGSNLEFDTVIVDEAAQCVEMSALIPLKYGAAKVILVGDPKQLPPTVFSREAARFQYEQSLFVRMQKNHPKDVHLLDTQYRMHPHISLFPSQAFYDGRLLDGPDMEGLRTRPWHATGVLAPYRFFNVSGQHQSAGGHSLINIAEIDAAIQLYRAIKDLVAEKWPEVELRRQVGVITPYKSQLRELKARFSRAFGPSVVEEVEFNTTDAFQGRESEIIIFSCVRASPSGGVGFLQDIRRMNVGLTRAKSSLWVLGNADSLMRGEYWKRLIENSQSRGLFTREGVGKLLSEMRAGRGWVDIKAKKAPPPKREGAKNGITEMEKGPADPRRRTTDDGHSKLKRKRVVSSDDQSDGGSSPTSQRPPEKVVLVSGRSSPLGLSVDSDSEQQESRAGPKPRDQIRDKSAAFAVGSSANPPTSAASARPPPPTGPASMSAATTGSTSTVASTDTDLPAGGQSGRRAAPKAIRIPNKPRPLPGFAPMRSAVAATTPPTGPATMVSSSSSTSSARHSASSFNSGSRFGNVTPSGPVSSSSHNPSIPTGPSASRNKVNNRVNDGGNNTIVSGVQKLNVSAPPTGPASFSSRRPDRTEVSSSSSSSSSTPIPTSASTSQISTSALNSANIPTGPASMTAMTGTGGGSGVPGGFGSRPPHAGVPGVPGGSSVPMIPPRRRKPANPLIQPPRRR